MRVRVAILAAIVIATAWGLLRSRDTATVPQTVDTTLATDNRNEDPYVGHQRCAECHTDIHDMHMQSSHASTFALTRDSLAAKSMCGKTIDAGDQRGRFHYSCDKEGLTVSVPERFGGRQFPLEYALGSGKHAVTFVTLLPEGPSTVAVEHRYSVFAEESTRVTPGQEAEVPGNSMEVFGKVFREEKMRDCISCHVTTGKIVDRELHDLRPNVNCERCHGPGHHHVAAAELGNLDEARSKILVKRTAAEEVAMCGECHRTPEDIEPERLAQYPNSLVRFQPVGLLQSRCYVEGLGKLRCTTCHDPHSDVGSRSPVQQEKTCLSCHSEQRTVCSAGNSTDCIRCHMPAVELLPGISFHDHWIRVRRERTTVGHEKQSPGRAGNRGKTNVDG